MFAAEAELWLDQFFPSVEILFYFVGEDLAKLGVDAADVGGQGFNHGEQQNHEDRKCAHGRLAFVARSMRPWGSFSSPLSLRSRRAILPASTS